MKKYKKKYGFQYRGNGYGWWCPQECMFKAQKRMNADKSDLRSSFAVIYSTLDEKSSIIKKVGILERNINY